jgi:hypothetical protein
MGAYIEIMSNHNLDLTDISSLAKVIANKFQVNIKYSNIPVRTIPRVSLWG